jgi:benzoate membrane transport protein
MAGMERLIWPPPGLATLARDGAWRHPLNAFVAFLFAASGPVAIILASAKQGNLSEAQLASWIFAVFAVNGALTLVMSLLYRQPLAFFWTIPGTVLVGAALRHLSFAEAIGAFYATGLLLLVLGLSGSVKRIMAALPLPIVMGMVAGVFLRFGLEWIEALWSDLWIALPMTAVFVILSAAPAFFRNLPPMIGVLAAGVLAVALGGDFAADWQPGAVLAQPLVLTPVFSWAAMVELVVPLAITVLIVQNTQGIAILAGAGHKAPANAIAVACGGGSLLAAIFGAVSSCLTGPVNAILSSDNEPGRQYIAALWIAGLAILFALFAPLFTGLMLAAPAAFIATLAGLAMLKVLQGAFAAAFQGRCALGALITFLITVSEVSLFNIGAPFWGLIFGLGVSWLLERDQVSAAKDDG